MSAGATILRAAFAFSPSSRTRGEGWGEGLSILPDAAIAFANGRILSVGPEAEVRKMHPDATIHDTGNAIILPGLINPHTHLELTNCARLDCAGLSFTDWILSLRPRLGRDRLRPEDVYPDCTRAGIAQCLSFGVTTVGDISQDMQLTRPILRASSLRAVSYGEVLGLGKLKPRYEQLLPRAIDRADETEKLRIGLSPHAPYTVDLPGYRQCLDLARRDHLPLATHLAETQDEQIFLEEHAGRFREVWETLREWDDTVETFHGPPIAFANAIGLLDYPTLLAHVNYCNDEDLGFLAHGRASVVYCPRTHAYFRHPPHRWREMLERGVNVAIGTDSCASSPDLNIVEDLRLVRRLAPDVPADVLWSMVTIRAARALDMDQTIGWLDPGKAADFTIFPVKTSDPLNELLDAAAPKPEVWIAGEKI